jgi:hypothetical protein
LLQRGRAVARLADHLKVWLRVKQALEAVAQNRMVARNQNASRHVIVASD